MASQETEKTSDEQISARDLRTYIESRVELLTISIAEQIATAVSGSIQKFTGTLFLGAGGLFLWIALGFYLGELLQSQSLGFLLAGLPLFLIGIVLYNRSSRKMEEKIQAEIIHKVTHQIRSAVGHNGKSDKEKSKD